MRFEVETIAIRRVFRLTLHEAALIASLLDGAEGTPEFLNRVLTRIDGHVARDAGTGKVILSRARSKLREKGIVVQRGHKGRNAVGAAISPEMSNVIRALIGSTELEAA